MSLYERLPYSPRTIDGREVILKKFFEDVTRSILSTDHADNKQRKTKTVIATLEDFTYFNPNVCKIIAKAENLGFDVRKKSKFNTTEEESKKAETFLINGIARTVSNALDPEDISILDRTKNFDC
jgi:hypothetical protein